MFGKMKKKVNGWLTNDDMEVLEEAATRKLKYPKVKRDKFTCVSCDYSWFYSSARCPVCSSPELKKA
ncbi:MAG TPA: hypothetical protein VJB11_01675 [archaeon]|nr:hypothetical protein [archaeon]